MVHARNKGASAERAFIKLMQSVVNDVLGDEAFTLERNLEQTRSGGCDVTGAPKQFDVCSVEIKRCEKLDLSRWWKQAKDQALRNGNLPILAYRQSRKEWRVIMPAMTVGETRWRTQANVSLRCFIVWYRRMLDSAKT